MQLYSAGNFVYIRIILGLIALICVIQGLWYVAFPLCILCAWIFPAYYEVLLLGLIYDSLFGFVGGGLKSYYGFVVAIILFFASEAVGRFVRK